MHRPTQTGDELPLDPERNAPRLIRFLRADAPDAGMEVFPLGAQSAWGLGRIDSSVAHRTSESAGRILTYDDARMSGRHATLTRRGSAWELADDGSKNGTFVNGERMLEPRILENKDVVECGSSFFTYRNDEWPNRTWGTSGPDSLGATLTSVSPLHYQVSAVLPFAASALGIHLVGETGTGKEVVARAIHDLSGRRGPFVARNCAAIPDALFESELFGHVKGAFTGATSNKRGQVQEADGGTLFLDEIGELSLSMQAKLLRVLELKEVLPLGATSAVPVDFRLISATLRDLGAMVREGEFRRDLYARLGHTFPIAPLREQREYIGTLLPVFLTGASLPEFRPTAGIRFSVAAARAIALYAWPLNVRELKQCVERALLAAWAMRSGNEALTIEARHLPVEIVDGSTTPPPPGITKPLRDGASGRRASDDEIVAALKAAGGSRGEAAKLLGVSERTVFRRIQKLRPCEG